MIIFDYRLNHEGMAEKFPYNEITSAGFVDLEKRTVHGYSMLLNLSSKSEDEILLRALYPIQ
jgi:hypothetical protein